MSAVESPEQPAPHGGVIGSAAPRAKDRPPSVRVANVSKSFRLHTEKRTSLKERFVRGKGVQGQGCHALQEVSFAVPRGQTWALIGHNGSCKSTMLKLLAGVHRPTSGTVAVDGRISALLELGAGFHPELTGRENIYLNASILGLSRKQTDASIDRMINFADLRPGAVDEPVKTYSSGMYVRLGFAIAVTVEPEILIIDEIVAVGDEEFQRKCFDYLFELRRRGTTIIMVTHSMGVVEELCDGAVWLDHGRVKSIGQSREVVRQYLDQVNAKEAQAVADRRSTESGEGEQADADDEAQRRGSGEVRIRTLTQATMAGDDLPVQESGAPVVFRIGYESKADLSEVVFGLGFVHESGFTVAGPNSGATRFALERGRGTVEFAVPQLSLGPGIYEVSVAAVDKGHVYDYRDRAFELRVRGTADEPGLGRMFGDWRMRTQPEEAARVEP